MHVIASPAAALVRFVKVFLSYAGDHPMMSHPVNGVELWHCQTWQTFTFSVRAHGMLDLIQAAVASQVSRAANLAARISAANC